MAESEEEKRIRELEIKQGRHDERLSSQHRHIERQTGLWVWLLTGLGAVVLAGVAGVILVRG